MRDYKVVIEEGFKRLGRTFEFLADPNAEIDQRLPGAKLSWYPTYLAISDGVFCMFRPFKADNYLDDEEINQECAGALELANSLREQGVTSKVFFITDTIQDVESLERQRLPEHFGILHNELEKPLLDFSVTDTFKLRCRVLATPLTYLANCTNLQGKIGDRIRRFSKAYLRDKPESDSELEMIRSFMKGVLTCDERFALSTQPIDFMANLERIAAELGVEIRDHYFHALNTMMLGFVVIDKFYGELHGLIKARGTDIVPEFIWLLTSLYHDIGYPARGQEVLTAQIFGLEEGVSDAVVRQCCRQNRSSIWNTGDYTFVVDILDNLFSHTRRGVRSKWVYDAFPRESRPSKFKQGLKTSFIEDGAHGAVGALRLALLTKQLIKQIDDVSDRQFLYRHIVIASLSILFHDPTVRRRFEENSLKHIEAKRFPLSMLLTYVDILQDDRRDMTGSSSLALFKGVEKKAGKIVAVLDKNALTTGVRLKLREQLEEALSFFAMNGLAFDIPEELREEGE